MSGRNITCGPENFAKSIEALIGDIPPSIAENVNKAVAKSVRKGAKEIRSTYATGGKHAWSDEYREGFTSHVDRSGMVSVGEIGNKNKPGLVHLLEKGHATLTGRRTAAYPHLAPAFEEIQEDFVEEVQKAVGEALR